jgi:hypothetical protein
MDSYYRRLIRLHVRVGLGGYKYIIVNIMYGQMTSDKVWNYVINWESVLYNVYIAMEGGEIEWGGKNVMMSERWRCTVEKGGGGGRKQVIRTGLVRCERVTGLHVPVREELWLSDEPKRDVCIFVTDVRDVLKRQIMDHFRNICCAGRLDLSKSGKSDLQWNITNRFVYLHCYPQARWLCSTNIEYLRCCRQSWWLCLTNIECCRVCRQLCQLISIKIQ